MTPFFLLVSDFYLSLQQDFIVSTFVMDNWNIRQEGSTLYISLEYEFMSSAQEPDLSEDEDDEWQQKMAEATVGVKL